MVALCALGACDSALNAAGKYTARQNGQPDHTYYSDAARVLYRAQPHTWVVAEQSSDMEGRTRHLLIDTAHIAVSGATHASAWVATVSGLNGRTTASFGQLIDFSCDSAHRDEYASRQDFSIIAGGLSADSNVAVSTWDKPFEQHVVDPSGDMAFFGQIVCDLTWQRRGSPSTDFEKSTKN